jgi:hypothetical protein
MPDARYFVERLKAHSDAWMIKFDDDEYASGDLGDLWVIAGQNFPVGTDLTEPVKRKT